MVIPLLPAVFLGVSVATGTSGVKKSIKAGIDHENAELLNENSNTRVMHAAECLGVERDLCEEMLEKLGSEKVSVLSLSMKRFVETFGQIKNIDFKDSVGLDELRRLSVDKHELKSMENSVHFAVNVAKSTGAGLMGGALVAFGAFSAGALLGKASTGTAIASLSGVAAKNATLAFFGGGSMASGGLGMAGGRVVLGGMVVGPALWVMGTILSNKEGKNYEIALANAAEADQTCEQLRLAGTQCEMIRRRGSLLYATLARLDARFLPLVFELERVVSTEGVDYSTYSRASKETVAKAAALAVSVKAVIDTPLLDDDGNLTESSKLLLEAEMRKALEQESGGAPAQGMAPVAVSRSVAEAAAVMHSTEPDASAQSSKVVKKVVVRRVRK